MSNKSTFTITKKTEINLDSLVAGMEMAFYPKKYKDVNSTLARGVSEFINRDKVLIHRIQKVLFERLKYSTGGLYNAIKFSSRVGVGKEAFNDLDSHGLLEASMVGTNNVIVVLEMTTNDSSLMNALLGEEEQDPSAPIPSISELSRWIRGKIKYFNESIDSIKENQEERYRKNALRLQRAVHFGYRGKNAKLGMSELNLPDEKNPVAVLSEIIRGRMLRRTLKGLSPTKGSEYTLLGNYPKYDSPKGAKSSFSGMYRKFGTPLLTRGGSKLGAINVIIDEFLKKDVIQVVSAYLKKMNTNQFPTAESIANGLALVASTSQASMIMEMTKEANILLKKLNIAGDRKTGIPEVNAARSNARLAIAAGQTLYNEVMVTGATVARDKIKTEIKNVTQQMRDMAKLRFVSRRRRASRRRGR